MSLLHSVPPPWPWINSSGHPTSSLLHPRFFPLPDRSRRDISAGKIKERRGREKIFLGGCGGRVGMTGLNLPPFFRLFRGIFSGGKGGE